MLLWKLRSAKKAAALLHSESTGIFGKETSSVTCMELGKHDGDCQKKKVIQYSFSNFWLVREMRVFQRAQFDLGLP